MLYFLSFIAGFLVSSATTPLVMIMAAHLGIIDNPERPRKLHERPTPLLGGLALYVAFCLVLLLYDRFGLIRDEKILLSYLQAVILGGGVIIFGGFLDDWLGLKPRYQFFFPLASSLIVVLSGMKIAFVTHPFGGVLHIPEFFGIILTLAWVLGMMYTTKFLDGLDGLASGVAIIASLTIFIVSLFWDEPSSGTSFMSMILAGVCLAFLLYNFHPAKIFLGESGSVLLGFLLAIFSIVSGSKIATAFLVMSVPIIDTLWVIVQRIRSKSSPVVGDRRHFHFKLMEYGFSHRQAVIFLYGVTLVLGITALFLHTKGKILALIITAAVVTFIIRFFYGEKQDIRRGL